MIDDPSPLARALYEKSSAHVTHHFAPSPLTWETSDGICFGRGHGPGLGTSVASGNGTEPDFGDPLTK